MDHLGYLQFMDKWTTVQKSEKEEKKDQGTGRFTKDQRKHMCCDMPMEQQTIEFSCAKCGRVERDVDVMLRRHVPGTHPIQVNLGGKQKILSGPYQSGQSKGKSRIQIGKLIREKMGDILIPDMIINQIERDYNQIQMNNDYRSSQKDEVIAFLIFNHMAAARMYIRRQDIALKMGLHAKSFTDGERAVHDYYIREGIMETDTDQNALVNLSMEFANRFGIADDTSLGIIAEIAEVIQRECIIESVSIGTRACCVVCIFMACVGQDITFREIEKQTQCKKNTIFKAFVELNSYYDDFEFVGERLGVKDITERLESFRATVLKIKKRKNIDPQ